MLLKTEVGVDILDIAEGKDLIALTNQMDVLGAALWILCKDQATALSLDEKAFFRRFKGEAVAEATEVLIAECLDFFPPKKSALLRSAYEKIRAAEDEQIAEASAKLDTMTKDDLKKLVIGLSFASRLPDGSPLTPESSSSAI